MQYEPHNYAIQGAIITEELRCNVSEKDDMAQADNIAIAVARGRAKYLRDRREVKTPQIIERLLEIIAAHESRAQPASASEPRFFIDHGVIHDRKRGRHILGSQNDADTFGEPLQDTVDALNAMEAATKHVGGLRQDYLDECRSQAQPASVVTDDMVQRFLSWRLPEPWHPDNGIRYQRPNYAHAPSEHDWPTGTNLFDAHQARAMLEHVLAVAPQPPAKEPHS